MQPFPRIMKLMKVINFLYLLINSISKIIFPTLKYFPSEPILLRKFEKEIQKIEFGGAHMLLLDGK